MKKALLAFAALASLTQIAQAAERPVLYEEAYARAEEQEIFQSPIAGIQNERWFDYRLDVIKAQKKLHEKLREADDIEDRRRSWERYAVELKERRFDYIEYMAKKGYRLAS